MAGTAAWCLGDEKLAIKYWRKGTKAVYAVGGANTRTELLLYAASLMNPATFPVESAEQFLIKKADHWRVKNWPGPIAQFILGTASEQEARQEVVDREGDIAEPNPKSWQFDFYKLLTSDASDGGALESGLQNLVNVKGSEYLAGIRFFTSSVLKSSTSHDTGCRNDGYSWRDITFTPKSPSVATAGILV